MRNVDYPKYRLSESRRSIITYTERIVDLHHLCNNVYIFEFKNRGTVDIQEPDIGS